MDDSSWLPTPSPVGTRQALPGAVIWGRHGCTPEPTAGLARTASVPVSSWPPSSPLTSCLSLKLAERTPASHTWHQPRSGIPFEDVCEPGLWFRSQLKFLFLREIPPPSTSRKPSPSAFLFLSKEKKPRKGPFCKRRLLGSLQHPTLRNPGVRDEASRARV